MLNLEKRTLLIAAFATLVGGTSLYLAVREPPRAQPGAATPTETAAVAPPPATTAPTVDTVAAPVVPPVAPTAPEADDLDGDVPGTVDAAGLPLAEALASSEMEVRRAAIEAAVGRKDLSALPLIQKVDLTQDGYVAAAAIMGVGELAAIAPPGSKKEAVGTLDRWLKQESKRKSHEALGNVSILVDSLESTKSAEAIGPLVAALDSASHPLPIETRIVQSLDTLNATSAADSVERFVVRTSAKKPADEFEGALITEALAAANAALTKWRGPQ